MKTKLNAQSSIKITAEKTICDIFNLAYPKNFFKRYSVETQYQFEQLVKMGCKLFQGYYFAKPMPLEDFEKFIQ